MSKNTDTDLIEITKKLVRIESVDQKPAELKKALGVVVDMIKASGKDITIEKFESNGIPSILAYRDQQRPANFDIILNGHLDVVNSKKEHFEPLEKDGKLYGRGVYDMKAAAVVLTDVFCEYVDQVPYALGLQITCDEEVGGTNGTAYQVSQGISADFAIVGECGRKPNSYEIANEAKGTIAVNVEFEGKTAHGAYPWQGQNAAMKAMAFSNSIHKLYPTPKQECQDSTITVTGFTSESGATNIIPGHASVKLDIRSVAGDTRLHSETSIVNFIKQLEPSAKVTFLKFSTPIYSDRNGNYIQKLKKAAETVENHPFTFVRRHGSSDARYLIDAGGEACEFGLIGENQHGNDEHVTVESFKNYRKTLQLFLKTAAPRPIMKAASPSLVMAK